MHITYITETYPPEVNGVSLSAARAVSFLRDRGHTVDIVRPRQPHEGPLNTAMEWRTAGVPLPMYPDVRFGLASVSTLRQRLQWQQPDVVHIATPGPLAWAAARAAHNLGLPISTDFRTNFHLYSNYYGLGLLSPLILRALRGFHNMGQRTHVPTAALHAQLARQGFKNLTVVGRGVDTNRFHPARHSPALRDQFAGTNGPLLLHVGRLAQEKNVQLALRAFQTLRTEMPEARMIVVGDGPQRAQLERRHPDVHFVGMQHGETLARYYASADLFLFPSLSDTFGNVVPEALASGLPVLAFDMGAAAELVRDSGAGLVVSPDKPQDFIAAACSLASRYQHLALMRKRARAVAMTISWEQALAPFEHSLMEVAHALTSAQNAQTRAA
ncbi:MAG: glycosyltransferase family 1 protein [Aquabacterium sp.]